MCVCMHVCLCALVCMYSCACICVCMHVCGPARLCVQDPITGEPYDPHYRTQRMQANLFMGSAEMLERAAGYSVMRYLPSLQTLTVLLANRRKILLTLKEYWDSFQSLMVNQSRIMTTLAVIASAPLWILGVVLLVIIYLGPYVLAPLAFVIKLRFQVRSQCIADAFNSAACDRPTIVSLCAGRVCSD
jgi:hypothetical protein